MKALDKWFSLRPSVRNRVIILMKETCWDDDSQFVKYGDNDIYDASEIAFKVLAGLIRGQRSRKLGVL